MFECQRKNVTIRQVKPYTHGRLKETKTMQRETREKQMPTPKNSGQMSTVGSVVRGEGEKKRERERETRREMRRETRRVNLPSGECSQSVLMVVARCQLKWPSPLFSLSLSLSFSFNHTQIIPNEAQVRPENGCWFHSSHCRRHRISC